MTNEIVAVITGITGDIGRATALSLVKEGVCVFGIGHNESKVREVERELQTYMSTSRVYSIDFTDPLCGQKLSEALINVERIDWIIHIAGFIDANESFENLESLNTTFQVNLFSIIELYKLTQSKFGAEGGVISISSTASIRGNGRTPLYATAKGALNTFTLSLAQSFRDSTKKAIVLCPGPTNTKMREDFAHDAVKHQSPEVVGGAIKMIVTGRSPYKNGDFIIIRDGIESLDSSLTS